LRFYVLNNRTKVIIISLKAHNLIIILVSLLICGSCYHKADAQEVSISPQLNIRNYYSYELLGKVDERFIVYRDKGFVKEVDVFNEYMEHTLHAELDLEKKKSDVFSSIGMDTVFQLIYGYLEKDTVVIKMRRYNKQVSIVDSSTDNDNNRIIRNQKIQFLPGLEVKKKLREVVLTDEGAMVLGFFSNDYFSGKNEELQILMYDIYKETSVMSKIDFEEYYRKDTYLDYDNVNQQILICGLYSEKKAKEAKGIYTMSRRPNALYEIETPTFVPFSDELIAEVSRTKKKKNKIFENFEVRQVVKRYDGGFLIMLELAKEFSRRTSYSTGYDRGSNNLRRGWVDYYNEDIIILSLDPDAKVDWSKILYKKQFSQDDEAIFSSFFILKTPSRMRLLYNDEIKKSNTVSEYILDPTGKVARNSLLSTEDADLKLRFRDAVQINNKELIVPSENNFDLNLVKISY